MGALSLVAMVLGAHGLAQPGPAGSFLEDPEAFIGTTVTVPASFTNLGDETGYGPYLDVVVPAGSALSFDTAAYLGAPLVPYGVLTVAGDGTIDHPFHGEVAGLNPGDTVLVLELPFGSIIPGQPAIDVDLTFDLSPDAPITSDHGLGIAGGFRYGTDALDNPPPAPGEPGDPHCVRERRTAGT